MAFVDPGTEGLIRNLLMLTGQTQANRQQQVQNVLSTARPGMTWEQLGITPQQFRAAFGRKPKPGEVVKQHTGESLADEALRKQIEGMPPELASLFGAGMMSKTMGVPQITTPGGLRAQAGASESQAQAQLAVSTEQLKLVQEGLTALQAAPADTRIRIGQERALGKSTQTTELEASKERTLMGQEAINRSIQEYAQSAIQDPNHPFWKLTEKKLGVNQVQALGAAALGMTQMIYQVADLNVRLAASSADRQTALTQAEAQWAAKVGADWGITPTNLLNEKHRQEAGLPPSADRVGQVVQTMTHLSTNAIIHEATQKGDPQVQQYQQLLDVLAKVKDKRSQEAASELIRMVTAKIAVTNAMGVPQNPDELARFNDAVGAVRQRLPRLDANFLIGGVSLEIPPRTSTIPGAPGQYSTPGGQQPGTGMIPPISSVPANGQQPAAGPAATTSTMQVTYPEGTTEESIRAFEEFAKAFFQPMPAATPAPAKP